MANIIKDRISGELYKLHQKISNNDGDFDKSRESLKSIRYMIDKKAEDFCPLHKREIMILDSSKLQIFLKRPSGSMKRGDFVNKFMMSKRNELDKVNRNFRNIKSKLENKILSSNISDRFSKSLIIKRVTLDGENFFGITIDKEIINILTT
tara:strand:+ start:60 stop:512 length:453 start_codon:yes stop_codon:yes gene_type:complete